MRSGSRSRSSRSATRPRPATSVRPPPTRSRRRWSTIRRRSRSWPTGSTTSRSRSPSRPASRTCPRRSGAPGNSSPRRSSTSRPRPTPPSAAITSTSRFKGVRAAPRKWRARPRGPAAERGIEPTLSIHNAGQPRSDARLVARERVVPERIVKPGGPVSRDFVSAFTTPRIGETLFQLVADRIDGRPTLTYEPEVTAKLRDEARSRVQEKFDTYTKGDVLVEQGQAIGEEQLILLRMEHEDAPGTAPRRARGRAVGILGLVAALFLLTGYYVCWHERGSPATSRGSRPSAGWSSSAWPSSACWPTRPGTPSWSRWPSPR